MLWGDWRVCTFESPRSSLNNISCTRQFESKLSLRSFAKSLDKRSFFRKPTLNGLYTPFGSPVPGGQKPSLPLRKVPPLISVFSPQGRRGKPPYSVLYLPHLSLPCGRVLNPLPSPRPFQNGKGCNRTFSVLGTATLYGWRTIKGLRQVVRAGTA